MSSLRIFLVSGIVAGAFLALAPVAGLIWTILELKRTLETPGNSGMSNSGIVNYVISTIHSTAATFLLCPVGVVVIVVFLTIYKRTPES